MERADEDNQPDPDTQVERRLSAVPTFVWTMLGVLLVLVFIALLVFVFRAPPSWKADRSVGPPQAMPAPPQQAAPSTPTRTPKSSDLSD